MARIITDTARIHIHHTSHRRMRTRLSSNACGNEDLDPQAVIEVNYTGPVGAEENLPPVGRPGTVLCCRRPKLRERGCHWRVQPPDVAARAGESATEQPANFRRGEGKLLVGRGSPEGTRVADYVAFSSAHGRRNEARPQRWRITEASGGFSTSIETQCMMGR